MERKTEKGGKFRNVHCRTWNMARKLKVMANEKHPLDMPKKMKLQPGDIVYMEKKRTKAARTLKGVYHVLKAGESIHRVAQMYGMKMSTLYKLNGLSANDVPHEGMRLLIR